MAPAAGPRAPPEGRAPGSTGTIAGALRAGGLAGPGAGRGQRRGRTGRPLVRGRAAVPLPRQVFDRIRIRTIPIERGLIERGLIERGRLVGAGGGVVSASVEARLVAWIACGARGIGRLSISQGRQRPQLPCLLRLKLLLVKLLLVKVLVRNVLLGNPVLGCLVLLELFACLVLP